MNSVPAIGGDNLFANFTHTDAPLLKVVSHQCFTDADAAVFTMLGFKAAMQALVPVASIAVAIARQLGQCLWNFFRRLISKFLVASEELWCQCRWQRAGW